MYSWHELRREHIAGRFPLMRALGWAFALTAAIAVSGSPAQAQNWPTKPVRIIVPFPPGGGLDFFAGLTAQKLRRRSHEPARRRCCPDVQDAGAQMVRSGV